jgi:PPK2 family polyphosphate:nucleotide phosphotransferase
LDKKVAGPLLRSEIARLAALQNLLFANATWSVLLALQGMDAAGKDGAVRAVFGGVDPAGVQVTSFKAPTSVDLARPFLWRVGQVLPARGHIGVFNRSHYEEVTATRVHPRLLQAQNLPRELLERPHFWEDRIADIAGFENHIARQGTRVLKIFLNVSRAEQHKRLLSRLDDPRKQWKCSLSDLTERNHWDDYVRAYEAAIAGTAMPHAPWFIVPADQKWCARLLVAMIVTHELAGLGLGLPDLGATRREAIAQAVHALRQEAAG